MEIHAKRWMVVLLPALILVGCGKDAPHHDMSADQQGMSFAPKCASCEMVQHTANPTNGLMSEPGLTAMQRGESKWKFKKAGRYIEDAKRHKDFRANATLDDISRIASEFETEIRLKTGAERDEAILEYLILSELFEDNQQERVVDGMTGKVVCDVESFSAWSNRITVSYAFMRRAMEFAREDGYVDFTMFVASRYKQAVKVQESFAAKGMPGNADVMAECVSMLADELDREDGLPKKLYDHYRSGCKTDDEAKYILNFISRRMGRLPKWAETNGSANEGGEAEKKGATQ